MRLYSFQSIEVVSLIYKDSIYFADLDKCFWLTQEDDHPAQKANWRVAWEWLMLQYNKRKKHDFSSAPVWWYTSLKELKENIQYNKANDVLITADVPDELVLLYDADLWEEGPFSLSGLGWRGHFIWTLADWGKYNAKFDEIFDRIWNSYKQNPLAMIETWSEIFHIKRSDGTQRIHAITPYIDITWIRPRKNINSTSYEMEM